MTVHDLPVPPAPALRCEDCGQPRNALGVPGVCAGWHLAHLTSDDNPYKLVARYRKARKVADALLRLGATPASVPELEGEQGAVYRALAAEVAGTNVPSEVTWALVLELLRESG